MSFVTRRIAFVGTSLLCILGGFSTAFALEGAWKDLNPESPWRVTSENLWDVDFISASTGLIVGANGTILRTIDRGDTWFVATSGTGEKLDGVDFVDTTYATAVGANGTILRSTDGGTTWAAQASGTMRYLRDVFFIDAMTGWVVGDGGTVLRTTDGGTNWIAGNSHTTVCLYAVSFLNAQKGYIACCNGLIQTSNGGDEWVRVGGVEVCVYVHTNECNGFFDICFLDASVGFVVGFPANTLLLTGGSYFKTVNGGGYWVGPPAAVPGYFDLGAKKAIAFGNANEGLILSGMICPNQAQAPIAGPSSTVDNTALHTLDGGLSWSEITIPAGGMLYALSYGDEDTAYTVGTAGTILRWDRHIVPTEKRTWGSIKSIFGD